MGETSSSSEWNHVSEVVRMIYAIRRFKPEGADRIRDNESLTALQRAEEYAKLEKRSDKFGFDSEAAFRASIDDAFFHGKGIIVDVSSYGDFPICIEHTRNIRVFYDPRPYDARFQAVNGMDPLFRGLKKGEEYEYRGVLKEMEEKQPYDSERGELVDDENNTRWSFYIQAHLKNSPESRRRSRALQDAPSHGAWAGIGTFVVMAVIGFVYGIMKFDRPGGSHNVLYPFWTALCFGAVAGVAVGIFVTIVSFFGAGKRR